MRVLAVTDLYPPAATGGYERTCADVVRHWRRARHEVTVLTTELPAAIGAPHDPDVVRELPFGPDADAGSEQQHRAAAVVRQLIADRRPDVVSAWNLARVPQRGVLGAVVGAGVPLVVVACDGWLATAPSDLAPAAPGSRVVWVSEQLRVATAVPAWLRRTYAVIGSGIDPDTFPSRPRVAESWQGRLLYVGRLSPAKGAEDAITALRHLDPGTTLTVLGGGAPERRAELRAVADDLRLGDRVRFGSVDRADLPPVYGGADAVIFPSRWAEPFGLVPLEAMACSVPVVATGTGGSAGYLRDEVNALLVAPEDPASIARAVGRLGADAELRARLVRAGLRTSSAHGIDAVAAALAGAHESAARASV